MRCPRCGAENPDTNLTCAHCGASLSETGNNENNLYAPKTAYTPPHVRHPRPNPISAVLHALLYVFLFFGCQSFVISAYTTSLIMGHGSINSEEIMNLILTAVEEKTVSILLISNLVTVLVICLLFHLRHKKPSLEMGFKRINFMRIPSFAIYGIALNVFVSCTISYLPISKELVDSLNEQYSSLSGTSLFSEILSVVVVAALVEEIIFRGLAISRLKRGMSKFAAVLISAVLFGIAHGTPLAVLYSFSIGLIFGAMHMSFDSVIPGIICHAFFNLTPYVVPLNNNIIMLALYILSIPTVILLTYRLFFSRPTFSDILSGCERSFVPETEEESAFIARVNALKTQETVTAEEIEGLNDQWTSLKKLRRERHKTRKNK